MDAGVELDAVAPSDAGQGAGVSATGAADVGAHVAGEVAVDVAGGTANPCHGVTKVENEVAEGLGVNGADVGVPADADEAGADDPGAVEAGAGEPGAEAAAVGESAGADVADAAVVNSELAVHPEAARPGTPLTETATW